MAYIKLSPAPLLFTRKKFSFPLLINSKNLRQRSLTSLEIIQLVDLTFMILLCLYKAFHQDSSYNLTLFWLSETLWVVLLICFFVNIWISFRKPDLINDFVMLPLGGESLRYSLLFYCLEISFSNLYLGSTLRNFLRRFVSGANIEINLRSVLNNRHQQNLTVKKEK